MQNPPGAELEKREYLVLDLSQSLLEVIDDILGVLDTHLAACGIPLLHTAVFWSLRAEIRPSEISPIKYRKWLQAMGAQP